jgi:hypothetical protein
MKKITYTLIVLSFAVTSILSCKKTETEQDSSNCYRCRAVNGDGSLAADKQLCTDAEKATFRTQNAGKEIDCN